VPAHLLNVLVRSDGLGWFVCPIRGHHLPVRRGRPSGGSFSTAEVASLEVDSTQTSRPMSGREVERVRAHERMRGAPVRTAD
jgi:hypothetical protein